MFNTLNGLNNKVDTKYLGRPNLLCICNSGRTRSLTASRMLAEDSNFNTCAAGVHEKAFIPISRILLEWADEILCFDNEALIDLHKFMVKEDVHKKVYLYHTDISHNFDDVDLIQEIKRILLPRHLGLHGI